MPPAAQTIVDGAVVEIMLHHGKDVQSSGFLTRAPDGMLLAVTTAHSIMSNKAPAASANADTITVTDSAVTDPRRRRGGNLSLIKDIRDELTAICSRLGYAHDTGGRGRRDGRGDRRAGRR